MVLSLFGKFIKGFFWGRLALLPIGTGQQSVCYLSISRARRALALCL